MFETLKDGSFQINSLVSNNCFSYRNVFQTGVNALLKFAVTRLKLHQTWQAQSVLNTWTVELYMRYNTLSSHEQDKEENGVIFVQIFV